MTEFEELALKKITKDYLVDCVYTRLNLIAGRYGISNAQISKQIGWDPAGYNQKYNRSNDLRITTFIKIYVALTDLICEREAELELDGMEASSIRLDELITHKELDVGALFNHISAAAEGKVKLLNKLCFATTYKEMKPFVLVSKKKKRLSDKEIQVYINYYKTV